MKILIAENDRVAQRLLEEIPTDAKDHSRSRCGRREAYVNTVLTRCCWRRCAALAALLLPFSQVPAKTSDPPRYELVGQILESDGTPLRGISLTVTLQCTTTSLSARTRTDSNGQYRFKKLETGMYMLIVAMPRAGSLRRTIEIGPSLADREGKVYSLLTFDRKLAARRGSSVPANQLSIPEEARQEYQKGLDYLGRQKIDRAIEAFEKAISIAPQFSGAYYRLGDIAFREGRYEEAASHYQDALDYNPIMFLPRLNLGSTLLALHKYEDALKVNLEAEKMRPDDPLAQAQLGYNFFYLDRFEEAIVHLRKAKEIDPSHFSFPQLLLAEIYKRRQDVARMTSELEEYLRFHPDSKQSSEIRKILDGLRARQPQIP